MSPRKKKVFISYSSKDGQFVNQLVSDLKNCNNLEIWEYSNEISVGDSIPDKIGQALSTADKYVIVLSPNSVSSQWVDRELNTAINTEISKSKKGFVVPVLYQDCQRPKLIEDKLYANFTLNYQTGLQELLKALGCKTANPSANKQPFSKVIPAGVLNAATKEITVKVKQMPEMRPGYDLGEEKELREVGQSKNGTMAVIKSFQNGMMCWHEDGERAGETYATYGGIYYRYKALGETPWKIIGFPIGDEDECAASPFLNNKSETNKGRYSEFENGEIVWYWLGEYRDQAFVILDPIRKFYDSVGGSGSYLGFPISDTYKMKSGLRNDFEGGSVLSLDGKSTNTVIQLLKINYSDSPLGHEWYQYAGPKDEDCVSVRMDNRIGYSKPYIAFNFPFERRALHFPWDYEGKYTERYCGITIKSLTPTDTIKFYLRLKTDEVRSQYLEYDSHFDSRRFVHDSDDDVDYFQIPMPAQSNNGEFHTLIVDLQKSVKLGFGREYQSLRAFYFRGHVGIADLMVSDSREAIEAIAINPIIVE